MAKILVIDDVRGVRRSIVSILRRAGHTVEEAESGQEGVALGLAGRYDLVVTDILMPDMDGAEVITTLRRECPGTRVLAVSGGGSLVKTEDALVYARHVADGVLPKPFEGAELLAAVDQVLARAVA